MALEFLQDWYYSLEDRIGRNGIITLAIGIIAIIIIAFFLLQPAIGNKKIELDIVNESGAAIEGVLVKYTVNGTEAELSTNSEGKISFEAALNSSIEIEIEEQTAQGKIFEAKTDSFTVTEDTFREIILAEKIPGKTATERTIVFKGADGARIEKKLITIRLSCANGYLMSPSILTDTDKDGTIKVTQPAQCDVLTAIVTGPSEFAQKTIVLDAELKTVQLESIIVDVDKGNLRITIEDEQQSVVAETSFTITLRKPDGSKIDEKITESYGQALFKDLPAGTYNATIFDESNSYGLANLTGIIVLKGKTTEKTATVSKNIAMTIKIRVIDNDTKNPLPNATVQLLDLLGNIVGEDDTGATAKTIVFPILEKESFKAIIESEGYVSQNIDINENATDIIVALEKIKCENSGTIKVRVIDEDGKPVEGAKAALRNEEDDFLASLYKIADINGKVEFRGLKAGTKYYAYASREPVAFGNNKEEAREIDTCNFIEFTVNLQIGDATLKLSAIDVDENPISEVEAEIFNANGRSLGKVPLPNGSADYTMRADNKVFVVFKHKDFATVHSLPKQLWPDKEFEFNAIMPPKAISGELKVEHEGIFGEDNEKTTVFESGKKYFALFKLIVPENKTFKRAGLHFRTGEEKNMESDPLAIVDATVGDAYSIIKGLTFNAPNGYETDSKNLTEGDAKWINIEIENAGSGIYYFGVWFRVKKTAVPNSLLTMHYRAYGIDSQNRYIRMPHDDELGESENTAQKQALYAKTIDTLRFYLGQAPECDTEFCYSGEWIFDNQEELYLNAPYEGTVLADYNAHFTITSNSEHIYENTTLFIKNSDKEESKDELMFKAYTIEDSAGKKISASNIMASKIEKIPLGNFLRGTSISGNLLFTTKKIGTGKIYLYIIADGRKVFEKGIDFTINSNKKMAITVEPDPIPALVENTLKITVTYEKDGIPTEIADALVTVKKTNPDKTTAFFTGRTNALGIVEITIPASSPGTKLEIKAEKTGYFAEPVTKEIVSDILTFDPASISAELDTRNVKEQYFDEKITNLTGLDLEIESIQVKGKAARILDIETMLNYSSNFTGKKILALDTTEFEKLFFVKLNPEALRELAQNASLDGNFWIVAINNQTKSKYDFMISLKLGVTIAELPAEPCIVITKSDWQASTQGNRATLEFEVQNNCSADEQGLALENLMARVLWSSNQMGSVEISLTDSETGETNTETLSAGRWSKLFARVRPFSTFSGFLTFTPKQGFLGKEAKFSVEIDGQMLTSAGLKFVGATPKAITANIKIINLEQCIQFPEAADLIKIPAGTQEIKFSIDSSNCGATEMEIALCREDSGKCSGGAEGSIQLSKINFSLTPEQPTQEITIMREQIPGMYGIIVEAKVPGKSWQKIKTIDLLVEPNADYALSLDKYAFVIKGIGSKDSATVINKNVTETVTVDASATDWGTAAEKIKEDTDNGMNQMLPLMALPLMMGALQPLMASAGNAGEKINEAKQKTTPEALKYIQEPLKAKIDDIKNQIDDLSDLFDKFENDLLEPADKSMQTLGDRVDKLSDLTNCDNGKCNVATSIVAIKKAKDTAETKYKECKEKYYSGDGGGARKSFDAGKTAMEDAQEEVQKLSENLAKAINDYKPTGAANFADMDEGAASAIANVTSPAFGSISGKVEKCGAECQKALKNLQGTGENDKENMKYCLGEVQKNLKILDAKVTVLENILKADTCEIGKNDIMGIPLTVGTACKTLYEKLTSITKGSEGVKFHSAKTQEAISKILADSGIKKLTDGLDKIVKDIGTKTSPADGTAFKELENAQNSAKEAAKNRLQAAEANKLAQTLARKAPTDPQFGKSMNDILLPLVMMSMLGGLNGGANSAGDDEDPSNDRVQQPVTAWVVNLAEGANAVTMDKPGIDAYWDLENMRLIGQYERQEAGLIFENTGIAEPEPVYSTATLRVEQVRHSSTVRFPSGIGLGQISGPMLQMTASGFNGPADLPGTKSLVSAKFHLKFTTMDFIAELPPVISEKSCLQGTMIGSTGAEALPKVKLNWSWNNGNGINTDSCIESQDGVYCDASQFSIMLSKRLKILQEFLAANENMSCPTNPGVEIIKEITQNYNKYLIELGLDPLPAAMEETIKCWIPKSTIDIGSVSGTSSKTALEYYIENNDSVNWTQDIQSIDDLRSLLRFKALLIKDGYSNNFKKDFADYFVANAFMEAPAWFSSEPTGKLADYFYSDTNLVFTRKFLDSSELLAPGTYETNINIDFGDNWKFFDSKAKPRAKIIVVFNYLQEPYPNNVFYYLPFNANVGKTSSEGRNGYGLNYENESQPFIIGSAQQEAFTTATIPGSTGIVSLNTFIKQDAKALNSIASTRGLLLRIATESTDSAVLEFSPNFATPVSLKISSAIKPEKFSAFYELHESKSPRQTGSHLAFWSAMGQCYDFTGVPLAEAFDFTPDRQASSSDPISNWQFGYGLDWEKAEKAGDVFLRTVFYTPNNSSFTLNAIQPSSLAFRAPDTGFESSVELPGISGMLHNDQKASSSVNNLQELFEMVQAESVCVTSTGSEALFWWNPVVLYQTPGANGSQESLNASAQCIK